MQRKPISVLLAAIFSTQALALPSNPTFVTGAGSMSGNTVTLQGVNGQNNALVAWGGGFNIGAGEILNFKDGTGNTTAKNIVNMNGAPGPATLSGGLYADNNLRILVVSPAGVNIDSTATVRAGNFAAFSGAAAADPSGQIVISGNSAPLNYSAGAAILVGGTGYSIGPAQAVNYRVTMGDNRLPWLDGRTSFNVDRSTLPPGATATLVGTLQAGSYDAGGADISLTGTAKSGSATITNANAVTLHDIQLGQGTASTLAEWNYNADGTLSLVQPGASGTVSGFGLMVGSAAAPVGSLSIENVKVLGTSRLDGYANTVATAGTNKLTGVITAKGAVLAGVLDGIRGPGRTADEKYTPGGGTATFVVSESLDLAQGLTVKNDHTLDIQLKNTAPLTSSAGKLDIQNANVYLRTLGSDVTLANWTLTGAPTTADSGNNFLEITAGKGTVDSTGKALGAPGWLDFNLQGLKSDNVNLRIDNGNGLLTGAGLRDVTISDSTINQGNNQWSGFFLETARAANLTSTKIDIPNGAAADSRVYISTQGYNGAAGSINLTDTTLRGANVLVGGGYGQLVNGTLADAKALNPGYVPGSDPAGSQWSNSQGFYNNLLANAEIKLAYDPSTGKMDAKRNTDLVSMTRSTVSGLATAQVAAKTRVTVDGTSAVIAEAVGGDGVTLIAGDNLTYLAGARAEASLQNLYSAKTATGTDLASANPALKKSDGSATAQAYIAAPTVEHAGLIKAGTGPATPPADTSPCVSSPASCFQNPTGGTRANPTASTPNLNNHLISNPNQPVLVAPGELPVVDPIVVAPGISPSVAPVILDTHNNPMPTTQVPGGYAPLPGTYFDKIGQKLVITPGNVINVTPAPGTQVTFGGNVWQIGPDYTLKPVDGGTYTFGGGTPALNWVNNTWVAAPQQGSTLTAPDGTAYIFDGAKWVASIPSGTTKSQAGSNYIYGSGGWYKVPAAGDKATDSNGILFTWDGTRWAATPAAGTTLSQGGVTYIYGGSGWLPAAGSQLADGGKSYAFSNNQWVWLPKMGDTAQNANGVTYLFSGTTWLPQYPNGMTTTKDGSLYQFSNGSWLWQPQPGDTATNPANGVAYRYDGSQWLPAPVAGSTAKDPLNNTWGYTGAVWTPTAGSVVVSNQKNYTWDGAQWVWTPSAGATLTDGSGLRQVFQPGTGWVSSPVAGSTLTDGNGYTWTYGDNRWVLQSGATTNHGVNYTWSNNTWTPAPGTALVDGGIRYSWTPGGWVPALGSTVARNNTSYTYGGSGWQLTDGPKVAAPAVQKPTDTLQDMLPSTLVSPVPTTVALPKPPVNTKIDIPAPGSPQPAVNQPAQTYGRTIVLPVSTEATGGAGNWQVYLGAEKIAR